MKKTTPIKILKKSLDLSIKPPNFDISSSPGDKASLLYQRDSARLLEELDQNVPVYLDSNEDHKICEHNGEKSSPSSALEDAFEIIQAR
jgi:hypothetical protein